MDQPVYDEPYCHGRSQDYYSPQNGVYGCSGFWDIPNYSCGCVPDYARSMYMPLIR